MKMSHWGMCILITSSDHDVFCANETQLKQKLIWEMWDVFGSCTLSIISN